MYTKYTYDKLTVTAQNYNNKVSVEIPSDASLCELMEAFKTLTIGLTYSPDSWKDVILQLADEYREIDEYQKERDDNLKTYGL